MWFRGQAADCYDSGIQKLVPRLNKCFDNASDYVKGKGHPITGHEGPTGGVEV
jgi:hypothetical protein